MHMLRIPSDISTSLSARTNKLLDCFYKELTTRYLMQCGTVNGSWLPWAWDLDDLSASAAFLIFVYCHHRLVCLIEAI